MNSRSNTGNPCNINIIAIVHLDPTKSDMTGVMNRVNTLTTIRVANILNAVEYSIPALTAIGTV